MVLFMRLVALAATAGVASAFAPSTPLSRSTVVLPSSSSSSSRLYETVAPKVDSNPYETHTLEEVLTEAAEKFHAVVKHGLDLPEHKISSLDPFNAGTISVPIKNKQVDLELTFNDAVITGFDSIRMTSKPTVDFKEFKVGMSFHIDSLQLSTEDYDREGTMKVLFGEKDVSKMDRELTVTFSDISLDFVLDLDFPELYKPTLAVVKDKSKFSIGHLKTDLEGSWLFKVLAPVLKGKVTSIIAGKLTSIVDVMATAKLQQICEAQQKWVDEVNRMYLLRKATPLLGVDAEGNEIKPQVLSGLGGVGQLPIPMWWSVVSPPKDKMPSITMDEILATAKTGDLILASGVARGSYQIRRFTQSPYSHAILCVREPDFLDGKLVMLQATSGEHFDLLCEKSIRGIQVNDIGDYMAEYKKKWITGRDDPACLAFRRLTREKKSEEEEKKMLQSLYKFIEETNGIEYAKDWGMIPLYLLGLTGADLSKEDDGKTYYCASYVAEALMQWGLINDEFKSQQYSPRDFSEKYNTLPFVDSTTSYGHEYLVEIP